MTEAKAHLGFTAGPGEFSISDSNNIQGATRYAEHNAEMLLTRTLRPKAKQRIATANP